MLRQEVTEEVEDVVCSSWNQSIALMVTPQKSKKIKVIM